ncbi:MAG TPA: PA0069 family radical SAM protein [Balneolales bacterium]|nr:PA0069 family radical SAM protein [Balneolales bacterium]
MNHKKIIGRGADDNPANRYDQIYFEEDKETGSVNEKKLKTKFLKDHSKTIIAYNSSPDIGFDASINPYRGCEHGCIYCYARPTHEYLGFSAGLDFESRILVKRNAAELLKKELLSQKWKPQILAMSGVTDPYQPIEKRLEITRKCLKVLSEFRNPVMIITKNYLVTRDIDYLKELAHYHAVRVCVTVTTLDKELVQLMEPRTSRPGRRLEAVKLLADAGIPVGVSIAPVIPGLNDHEMPELIKRAVDSGAQFAFYVPVRLPLAVAPLFEEWLTKYFPDRKEKVLHKVMSLRYGKLNDSRFGHRFSGHGAYAQQLRSMFDMACQKAGMKNKWNTLSIDSFHRPYDNKRQLNLF